MRFHIRSTVLPTWHSGLHTSQCNFSVPLSFVYLLPLSYIRIIRDRKNFHLHRGLCPRRIDRAQAELQALEKESLRVYQDTVSSCEVSKKACQTCFIAPVSIMAYYSRNIHSFGLYITVVSPYICVVYTILFQL